MIQGVHWRRQLSGTGERAPSTSNNLIFFQLTLELHKECCSDFVRLPLQTCLSSATAAAVVQSRLHEPRSVYYFAPFCVQQKVS